MDGEKTIIVLSVIKLHALSPAMRCVSMLFIHPDYDTGLY